MDHVEIIEALQGGDCLHIRDGSEAARTGRPEAACLHGKGPVPMSAAVLAAQSDLVRQSPQQKPFDAPANWKPDGVCFVSASEAERYAEAVKAAVISKPARERFNNLPIGYTLDQFEWFEIMPCRNDEGEGCPVQCEAGEVEFWTIYGRKNEGTKDEPEFQATAIHDAWDASEIVRIARQIAMETGKGFLAGDVAFGQFPRRDGQLVPVTDFTELADDLTTEIHEDIWQRIPHDDQREDDFDNNPLAPLREAFVAYSDYSGTVQLDPYHPEPVTH